eukprot:scaffold1319_cov126-Cylindrotheca_fusiformis.AAC.26
MSSPPLLLFSDFHRLHKRTAARVDVKLSLLCQAPLRSNDSSSTCLASVEALAALSVLEQSFAFLCYGSEKTLVRLALLEEDEDDGGFKAMAPPIVFANLGILEGCNPQKPRDCWFENAIEQVPQGKHVVMRPLGRDPNLLRLFGKGEEDSQWVLPSTGTLVEQSKLLSVYDEKDMVVYYYEVLEIRCKDSEDSAEFCQTTKSTKIDLDGSAIPPFVCRLPPLMLQKNFYRQDGSNALPPHPNLSEMIRALCQPPSLDSREEIIHVVGTEAAHQARLCVETAADCVGMRCFSIRGLAAFGHDQGVTIRTGSLAEQLSGMSAALQLIRAKRMEPCVLHLSDFDSELSSTDDPMRQEQEERFWSHWMQALASNASNVKNHSLLYTPPIIIVISTTSALKPGPLLENLVFPSIVLDTPDKDFAKFLWKGNSWDDCFWENNLLKGRSSQDIVWLRQQVQTAEGVTVLDKLSNLCSNLDTTKRKQSSRVAKVSDVHWDDVGGLAHVRTEIMDAIELPLKHPHLFPSSGGRSGILLYGPPGTGKTLVAKAVATECGLPFFSVKGPELLGSYVGESEAAVRDIFHSARSAAALNAPLAASILFFDELDSLAPRRGGVGDGGGVMERVVATLFSELDGPDGMSPDEGRVFVMGATNRPDLLDPSLLRPGRLDRLVYLGVPTDDGERARVLGAQIRKLNLAGSYSDLAEQVVASLPPRLTGADLSAIASGALSHAVERLCLKADVEQRKMEEETGCIVEIALILEGWDEKARTPMVELDDLLQASKDIAPSLSEKDLERYERLRMQYTHE